MIKQKIDSLIIPLGFSRADYQISIPPDGMGDYSINLALKIAGRSGKYPMEVAKEIVDKISSQKDFTEIFSHAEVVHPGFINFYLKKDFLNECVAQIVAEDRKFGQGAKKDKKIQVEFISANPTGPLHLGNGRGGFFGDVLSRVLELAGYSVEREYYINDIGKQVETLAESVLRKYLHRLGLKVPYPEYCYQGKYIEDLAKRLRMYNYKIKSMENLDAIKTKIKGQVLKLMIDEIQQIAKEEMGIKFDNWFYESELYEKNLDKEALLLLKEKDLIYEKDGAVWFKATEFGDDKDRAIFKTDKTPTYFFSDILYLINRYRKRKFDKVIMVWGADHHGDVKRVLAASKVLGIDNLKIILYQLVRLMSGGKEVRMSKRKGTFVTIEELVKEVGQDVARFFFLKYAVETHMDFDLDLALEESDKNPVFYVQYAYARICSILREVKKQKLAISQEEIKIEHPAELALAIELIKFPDLIEEISDDFCIHKLPNFAIELATRFHNFYGQCRVIDNGKVSSSRLKLIQATQVVLRNTFLVMGVSAPEKMEKKPRKPRYLI